MIIKIILIILLSITLLLLILRLLAKLIRPIRSENFDSSEVLNVQEVKIPPISDDEVLVKIKASDVNPVDTYIREGAYASLPELPYIPGKDGAGIVERIGSNVTNLQVGQRVFICNKSDTQHGTCAQYSPVAPSCIFPLGNNLSFEEGAAIGIPYFTAYRALIVKGQATSNDLVFIHGASGAVGLAAIQIAKARGIKVIGSAGTQEGMQLVRECGADHVFCHKNENYISEIEEFIQDRKINIIIEMLENVNLNKDLQLLAPNGKIMVVDCRGSVSINPQNMMGPETIIMGIALLNSLEEEWKTITSDILKGIEAGWVKPIIDKKYSLEKCSDAHNDVIHS